MEQEGIYYFFRHEKERHVLVLADNVVAHKQALVYGYRAPSAAGESPRFSHWGFEQEPQPSSYTLTDFDFQNPHLDLEVHSDASSTLRGWEYEVFDYPGEFRDLPEGEVHVRTRLEEIESRREHVTCAGAVPGLEAGALFKLDGHPRSDQNQEYLVVSAEHELRWYPHFWAEGAEGAEKAEGDPYNSEIVAIPSSLSFRPPRLTPNAVVRGPQTAIVVGPEGEQVWTDEYGRVKVRFHWDRRGKKDGNDSCWIRVTQGRAGNHWGAMQIPHVGQEVIVDFLEGDPDRPIITGSVYNAANMPPLTLPKNQYKTVVARDHYGNEILFDGTPGKEHIRIHSPNSKGRLELGKYVEVKTLSNDFKATIGTSTGVCIGASVSATLGVKADFDFAPGLTVQTGHRRAFKLSRDTETSLSDRSHSCHEDYVIEVHGKKGGLSISADDKGKLGKATDRSMLFLNKDGMQLSYGRDVPQVKEGTTWRKTAHTVSQYAVYAVIAAAMVAEAVSAAVCEEDRTVGDEVTSMASGGVAALAGVISTIVAFLESERTDARPSDKWTSTRRIASPSGPERLRASRSDSPKRG
jgi:type VI secretion system secreted protein VgrG